jgi:hypothetical protein
MFPLKPMRHASTTQAIDYPVLLLWDNTPEQGMTQIKSTL